MVRGHRVDTVQPGFLRPLDTDRIARELKLETAARERGSRELPSTGDDVLDAVEQDVCQKIESAWGWQRDELMNQLGAYAARLVQFSIKSEFERLKLLGHDALAKLRAANIRAEADLGPFRNDFVASRDELSAFKNKHRLSRLARKNSGRFTTFGLMFILVAVESAVNGLFFAEGSDFGIIGGIGIAIGISFFNVALAFVIGLFPARWIMHRNLLLKLVGFVLLIAGWACLVGLQAFAAQYRQAVIAVGEDLAGPVAIEHLQTAPWHITSVSTVYLFGLGVLFSFLAFIKGARFDDPYPGFGPMSRRAESMRVAYTDAHADLFDQLEETKDETIAAIDEGVYRLPLFPQTAASIRQQRAALIDQFRTYETGVETAANQLLARYRDLNRDNRTTPAPPHFNSKWKLPHSFAATPQFATLTADVPESALDVDGPLAELSSLSREVLNEYTALLTKYPHSTEML